MSKKGRKDTQMNGDPARSNREQSFGADRPIRSGSEDRLGVRSFVQRLVQPLLSAAADGSLVIGLYAPWGHGKSSALNLLDETLRTAKSANPTLPEALIVRFTPWL